MIKMWFHLGSQETILFRFWLTESWAGIAVASIIIVAMCFVMESMRWLRIIHRKNPSTVHQLQPENQHPRRRHLVHYLIEAVVYAVQLVLAYMLMLVAMTYNLWLFAAVIVGEVAANAVFRVLCPSLEHCRDAQAATETCCG
ncbi:Protein Y58A7A.1 a [Aphelenchoides avenae]|nr:Protein Y58A7A.1 a [Aphelenchus avenae]